ncbi:MAG: hybrid sensor histidine kinase/response regulator [Ignavibacteriae bacterium]|nr:MAG: hybrid sensor histidine kinase/response regulator [Ignavibacteriota bacterium]
MESTDPTILVVDDTEDNLDLLEFALKRKPVRMLRASSGKECLQLAAQHHPDVILLDIQMPEMDGFETLKRLRASRKCADIPVIFLTARRKDALSIEQGLLLGAEEYLTKPIDTDELLVRTRSLVRLKKMEVELERTKADFMAMLIHDMRSPIGGISSILELLEEPLIRGEAVQDVHRELLTSAEDATKRLLHLINDMLDLSKFEAGKMNLSREYIHIGKIADRIMKQMQPQFKQKGILVKLVLEDNLPFISADANKISQVFANILSNALKFSSANGTVQIVIGKMQEGTPAGECVWTAISNTGIGILPEELSTIFERYKQGVASEVVQAKGTGLGLAICKLIVEAHLGTITAESEPGKLTVFRFTLPVNSPSEN